MELQGNNANNDKAYTKSPSIGNRKRNDNGTSATTEIAEIETAGKKFHNVMIQFQGGDKVDKYDVDEGKQQASSIAAPSKSNLNDGGTSKRRKEDVPIAIAVKEEDTNDNKSESDVFLLTDDPKSTPIPSPVPIPSPTPQPSPAPQLTQSCWDKVKERRIAFGILGGFIVIIAIILIILRAVGIIGPEITEKPTISPTPDPIIPLTKSPTPSVFVERESDIDIVDEVTSNRCSSFTTSIDCASNQCMWESSTNTCLTPTCAMYSSLSSPVSEQVCRQSGCLFIHQFSSALRKWTSKCVDPSTVTDGESSNTLTLEGNLKQRSPSGNCSTVTVETGCTQYPGCFWRNNTCYNTVFYKTYEFDAADLCSNWPRLRPSCVVKNIVPLPQTRVGFDKTSGSWTFIDKIKVQVLKDRESFRAEIMYAHDSIPARTHVYYVQLHINQQEQQVLSISKMEILPLTNDNNHRCRLDQSYQNLFPNAQFNETNDVYKPFGNPGYFISELLTRPWKLIPELSTSVNIANNDLDWDIPMRQGYTTATMNEKESMKYRKLLGLDQQLNVSSGPIESKDMLFFASNDDNDEDIAVPYFIIQNFTATYSMYQFTPNEQFKFENPSNSSCITESSADALLMPELMIRGEMSLDLEEGEKKANDPLFKNNDTCFNSCFNMQENVLSERQLCIEQCLSINDVSSSSLDFDLENLFHDVIVENRNSSRLLDAIMHKRFLRIDNDGFWSLDASKVDIFKIKANEVWNQQLGPSIDTCLRKHLINTCDGTATPIELEGFKNAFGSLSQAFTDFESDLATVEEAFMYIFNIFRASNIVYDVTQHLDRDLTGLVDVLKVVSTIPFLTPFIQPVITVLSTIREIIVTVGDNMRDVNSNAAQYKSQVSGVLDTANKAKNSVSYLQVTIDTFIIGTLNKAKCLPNLRKPLDDAASSIRLLGNTIHKLRSETIELISRFARDVSSLLRALKVDFLKEVAKKVLEIERLWDKTIGKIMAPVNAALDHKLVIKVSGPFCTRRVKTCLDVPNGIKNCKKLGIKYPCGVRMETRCASADVPTWCVKEFGFTVRQLLKGISSVLSIFRNSVEQAVKKLFSSINFSIDRVIPINLDPIKGLPNAASFLSGNRDKMQGEAIKLLGSNFPSEIKALYEIGLVPDAENTMSAITTGLWNVEPFKSLLKKGDLHEGCVGLPPTSSPTTNSPTKAPTTNNPTTNSPTKNPAIIVRSYEFISNLGPLTWYQAQSQCKSLYGTNLATITSAEEAKKLHLSSKGFDYWIGLNDIWNEGTYEWASGVQSSYRRWHSGEPNNLEDEDCGMVFSDSTWNDYECLFTLKAFACDASTN